MIQRTISAALKRYGSTVRIKNGGECEIRKAIVQPLRRKTSPYINSKLIPAGYFDRTYMLYIGDRDHKIKAYDTVVSCGGTEYTAVVGEKYLVGGEPAYVWAILRPKNKLREDDYEVADR